MTSESETENPFASPQSTESMATREPRASIASESELPSRWIRLWAAIIDLLILWPITIPLGLLLHAILRDRSIGIDTANTPVLSNLLDLMIALIAYLILNGQLLTKYGQTIGKYACKIKIVDMDDRHLPTLGHILLLRILVLSLFAQIPVLGVAVILIDSLMIFTPNKRCLHDYIASTIVVKA